MYLNGKSICPICDNFNEENTLNRKWITITIDKILFNKIYIDCIKWQKKKR